MELSAQTSTSQLLQESPLKSSHHQPRSNKLDTDIHARSNSLPFHLSTPIAMAVGQPANFRHLGRNSAHRQALLRNLIDALFTHESITTTWAKAKEAQRLADKMITLGKKNTEETRRKAQAVFFVCDRLDDQSNKYRGPASTCPNSLASCENDTKIAAVDTRACSASNPRKKIKRRAQSSNLSMDREI
jgi:ribosomal protein L17